MRDPFSSVFRVWLPGAALPADGGDDYCPMLAGEDVISFVTHFFGNGDSFGDLKKTDLGKGWKALDSDAVEERKRVYYTEILGSYRSVSSHEKCRRPVKQCFKQMMCNTNFQRET